jgi:hypothetical protein
MQELPASGELSSWATSLNARWRTYQNSSFVSRSIFSTTLFEGIG